jgi:hypothetical protein
MLPGFKTSSWSAVLGVILCAACSSRTLHEETSPDAGAPDGAVPGDAARDPLAAFSAASRDYFHLVVDGKVGDGRVRVYYVPRVMWLGADNGTLDLAAQILTNPSTGERRFLLTGTFVRDGASVAAQLVRLQNEADAAQLALIRADLGLAHTTCPTAATLFDTVFGTSCVDARVISFGPILWQGAQRGSIAFDTVKAAIDAHLADGSAWDDVLAGDITWHAPSGELLHTRLEISCIGQLFDASGAEAVKLFDSSACRLRYP